MHIVHHKKENSVNSRYFSQDSKLSLLTDDVDDLIQAGEEAAP